ncbi:NACHT domain-containing protein [Sinorhizobium chiapasense]|uniref:NACHT domain-containing protein n=1 Tax=Sinorhizobium chiapasense TaxID=501572 RepID=A0ABZ2BEB8_9HYPH
MIDGNKVAASVVTSLVAKAFNSVSSKATSAAKDAWAKIFEDFEPFMKDAYQKNAFVRLLSQKEKDVDLYSVYVKSSFLCGDKQVEEDKLIYTIVEGKNVVINGNGGAGKTFFMRHLWLTLFEGNHEYTPIFIELRKLNELTSIDLKSFIRISISRKKELSDDLFSYFCNSGRFCFILDGFDEIVHGQRDLVQSQILQLSSDFPKCRFVVSSRYERRFAGWQNFELYESQPFDLPKVKKLVGLVPFDPAAKKLFLKQLDAEFYAQNKSFLSNPLLAIMMMMTFKENMDIPRRMNIFYDQAFTTLFQWHDATKAFNRAKTLDIDEFQRSFGMFCLLSYHQEKFEFTKSEVIDLINKSSKICGITKESELILKDYEETVNLLKQEGLNYIFIHRSFQEYFCAYALMRIIPGKFSEIFSGIRKRYNDNVLLMCFEMNKNIVLDEYVRPLYKKLNERGTFKRSGAEKFGVLSSIDVLYLVRIRNGLNNERELLSMSFSVDEDIEELLNNVSRLMGYKANTLYYTGSILYHPEMFSAFHEISKAIGKECDLTCSLHFMPNEISASVTTEGEASENIVDEVLAAVNKKQNKFAPLEERVAQELEKLRKWCSKEIDQNSKRGIPPAGTALRSSAYPVSLRS